MIENKTLPKVSVIGAGNVGSTCAFLLAINSLADVYLFDKIENLAKAKALDIGQAAAAFNSSSKVVPAHSLEQLKGSEIVLMAAGIPRKPGMNRFDLIQANVRIAEDIAHFIKRYASNAVVIIVANPLDILTYIVLKETGFDRRRVFGMAGLVDNSRLRYFTSHIAAVDPKQVTSHVLGLHADEMVIPEEQIFVDDIPATRSLNQKDIEDAKESTRQAGAQIVSLLGNGSAYYLPGAGAYLMAKAVLEDSGQTFDASVYLEGEYGLTGVCLGVPAQIGSGGVKHIEEIDLASQSQKKLKDNVRLFKEQLQML